jgi:phage baseplate assembly protein V
MSAEIGDLQRRLANIFRLGKVAEVDRTAGRVKVQFGDALTAWLPWMTGRAGAVRDWNPPSVGEQVCVCSPMGEIESGFIMPGSIYTSANAAPTGADNTYRIDVPAGGTFEIRVGSSTMTFAGGKISLNCNVETSADVKAGTVSLKTHTHIHTDPEPLPTGAPIV